MIDKPSSVLDRDHIWNELTNLWRSPGPELLFLFGRRRVGKSYLLTRFSQAVGGVYYQATKRTEREQLHRLSAIIGVHFGDAALQRGVPFPDWESLFGYATDHAGGKPLLIVLDEFPYLSASAPALPSILQSLWDHRWPETGVKLILSGSHITAMRQLERADQPLYGRRTGRIAMEAFDCFDAAQFLPGYSARERLRAYGVFGGLPGHLALLNPERPLDWNAAQHLLRPAGRLVDEAQHMFDAFLADAQVHYSIIEAVAGGENTWGGITKRVGREGGSVSRAVRWLIEMRLVERVVPISERKPLKSKRSLYRITDPYVAFWHRFVSPMVNAGMIGLAPGDRLWKEHVAPRLDDYMGSVFEAACRAFVRRATGVPFAPLRVGEWWSADSRDQVDVVALGGGGEVLLGECKWGAVRLADVNKLRARADLAIRELEGLRDVHLALFSGEEPSPQVREEVDAGRVLHFSAADLYRLAA